MVPLDKEKKKEYVQHLQSYWEIEIILINLWTFSP